jgi:hypothetical protein
LVKIFVIVAIIFFILYFGYKMTIGGNNSKSTVNLKVSKK